MSRIGEKRPAEDSNGETAAAKSSPLLFGGSLKFSFRPSLLGEAASTLSTYSQKIESPSATTSPSGSHDRFKTDTTSKPSLSFTGPRIMTSASPTSASLSSGSLTREAVSPLKKRARDEQDSSENLFLRCLSESKMAATPSTDSTPDHTPASPGGNAVFGSNLSERVKPLPAINKTPSASPSDHEITSPLAAPVSDKAERDDVQQQQEDDDEMSKEAPAAAFGSTRITAILPEVERVTGEEGEKHILQIHCKLFMFDSSAHTWRERGRGDLRLNDVPHSEEGVFQSRLVMRAIGSLRVLLNTHLWAQMKCERASPKNIRITAQDDGRIGVFLIVGSQKDVNQLFTAIDRRLLALQRTATKVTQEDSQPSTDDRGEGPVQEERDSDEEERSPSTSPDWRARSPYHPSSSSPAPSPSANTTTQQPMESVPSSSPSL